MKRLRILVAVLAVAALVAGSLTAIALNRNATAERALRLATARELAGAALTAMASDPQLAALLALESIRTTAEDGIVASGAELTLRGAMPLLTIRSLGGVRDVWITPDVGRVVIVGDSGPTAVWEVAAGQAGRRLFVVPSRVRSPSECPIRNPVPRCDAVFRAALSDDGTLLATGHGDQHARVWDLATGEARLVVEDPYARTFTPRFPEVAAPFVGIGPDGRSLWTLGFFGDWVAWDIATGQELFRVPAGGWPSGAWPAFSDDGTLLAIAVFSRIEIWDLEAREVVRELPVNAAYPGPRFAPGGHVVAIATQRGLLLIDGPTGSITELTGLPSGVRDFSFSPDGSHVAAGTLEGLVRVWDVATGASTTLGSDLGAVRALAWSPDGATLAIGGEDGATRLFDATTGDVTVTLPDAGGAVEILEFTADGRSLAVASDDGVLRLHLVQLDEQIELVRDRVARGFTDEECRRNLHLPSCPG